MTVVVTAYKAFDGSLFYTPSECDNYERSKTGERLERLINERIETSDGAIEFGNISDFIMLNIEQINEILNND